MGPRVRLALVILVLALWQLALVDDASKTGQVMPGGVAFA